MSKPLPEPLTIEEVRKLLAQPNPLTLSGLRNLCMMKLMVNTGLRVGEVISLYVRDIDFARGKIMVHRGKGAKGRVVWINDELLDLLRRWVDKRKTPDCVFMFPTHQGRKLSDAYIRQMIYRYAERAGIQEERPYSNESGEEAISYRVHPHNLRHTFATEFYRETNNIRLTQEALGHKYVQTTQIYTHLVNEEREQAMREFKIG